MLLELLAHLLGRHLDRDPEVAEDVDQHDLYEHVRVRTHLEVLREERGRLDEPLAPAARGGQAGEPAQDHAREDHQAAGEDDRHDAGVVQA